MPEAQGMQFIPRRSFPGPQKLGIHQRARVVARMVTGDDGAADDTCS